MLKTFLPSTEGQTPLVLFQISLLTLFIEYYGSSGYFYQNHGMDIEMVLLKIKRDVYFRKIIDMKVVATRWIVLPQLTL